MPPMTAFLPKSVAVSPPETMPPTWSRGSSRATFRPSRAPDTAVMTPPAVPP